MKFHSVLILLVFSLIMSKPLIGQNLPIESEPVQDQSNTIRNYLMSVATEVTQSSLAGINSLEDWEAVRSERYDQLVEMLSLTDVPLEGERPPLNVQTTGTIQQEGFRIEKLYYESLPDLYVPANLYIPDNLQQPAPAILYVCGHSRTQKVSYQTHARKFAELGFVTLIIETIQWGEVRGEHWGCYANGWFHWYSRGYTPGGVELWNSIRGLDLLAQRSDVDPERMGVTGISGGGAYAWYVAAIDPRIQAAAPVCGTGTVESHVHQRTVDGHCDCMMPVNTYLIDVHDMGALFAPKPLLIASANRDGLFSIESIRDSYNQMKNIYSLYGQTENIALIETPGGHSYHRRSRTKIFSFFLHHLAGKDIPPSQVGDIDTSEEAQLSVEELSVYTGNPPPDDRTTTIQESFVKLAEPPAISGKQELETHKAKVKDFLQAKTFRAFPADPVPLDIRWEFRTKDAAPEGKHVYSYVPEEGWRLKMDIRWRDAPDQPAPLMLVLRSPDEDRWESESFISELDEEWNLAYLETRGIGETSWGPALQWHIRRAAAWTGRTIATMRVYDVLRALRALRSLEGINVSRAGIAARDDMGAVALYAALLDGNVSTLILKNPPVTQNAPSNPNGRGPAIEMLNVLRVTDVWQIPGLLYPAEVVFVDTLPQRYQWSRELYRTLGEPDRFRIISDVSEYQSP